MFAQSKYSIILGIVIIFIGLSCKKFVDIPPSPAQISSNKVFENDATADRAILGLYFQMNISSNSLFAGQTTFYAGLSADELRYYSTDEKQEFLQNQISQQNHGLLSTVFWSPAYKVIYMANACIEGITKSDKLSPAVHDNLIGEAKFIRAFSYFYLVNLFGDVPLALSTNFETNALLPRAPVATVYDQMVKDLTEAEDLLAAQYVMSDRVRPNKWAAAALLARVYLYKGDWAKAFDEAGKVIGSGDYQLETDPNKVFLKDSKETLFQLGGVFSNINTWEGSIILPFNDLTTPTYILTDTLLHSFEPGDLRKTYWVNHREYGGEILYYPDKYKVYSNPDITENYILIRLAEVNLIKAEAAAHMGDMVTANSVLNEIRSRAGLNSVNISDPDQFLKAIEQENKIEFFSEWGHRWMDLKRTNRCNTVIGGQKPDTWQATDTYWPIPSNQIVLNPRLTQNPGY